MFFLCLWNDLTNDRLKIITKNKKEVIPLQDMDIKANIYGTSASIDFNLKYKNKVNDTLTEARLVFPMDSDMALSDVILRYDNKLFLSVATEKSEGRAIYEREKNKNHTALHVTKSDDLLSIDLCAIPPHKEIKITFTLYANLPAYYDANKESFAVRFNLPTALFPRYTLTPSNDDEVHTFPGVLTDQPKYGFHITFELHSEGEFECLTKTVPVEKEGNKITVEGVPTDDFNVIIYVPRTPKTLYEVIGNSRVVNFKVNPVTFHNYEQDTSKKSIVFLLDCSGSMQMEDRMKNVKKAMKIFLHSLPSNCSFDILRFGSVYDSLFGNLTEYNDESLKKAIQFMKRTEPTMGGTEIFTPLKHIVDEYKPDIIFLLTDGAVMGSEYMPNKFKDSKSRIYALGVGAGADINLVRDLARYTGGTHEHIIRSSDIEGSIIRLLGDSLSPFLKDLTIDTDCGDLMQIQPTTISRNSILDLYFHGKSSSNQCHLTINGVRNGEQYSIDMDSSDGEEMKNTKQLHAISLVRATNDEVIDKNISIELSKKYNVLTKNTALILYDSETQHNASELTSVYVPTAYYSRMNMPNMRFFSLSSSKSARIMASTRQTMSEPVANKVDKDDEDDDESDSLDVQSDRITNIGQRIYTENKRAIGIETAGGLMTEIVARGETLPVNVTKYFNTAFDNQEDIKITVLEGSRPLAKDNNELETFSLKGIEKAKQGSTKIEINVQISTDGIIKVHAKVGNKEKTVKINNQDHFTDEKEANVYEKEDEEVLKRAEMYKVGGIECIGVDYCQLLTDNQMASGEWTNINDIIRSITGNVEYDEEIIPSIAALYLEKKCPSTYALLSRKGKQFIEAKNGKERAEKLFEKAKEVLD